MNSIQQILIGLTRLMAVFFAMRGLDSLATSALVYALRRSALAVSSPQTVDLLPSTDAFYMPLFAVYVVIALIVWFAAPFVCVHAVPIETAEPLGDATSNPGPYLIFGIALLIVGYSIQRIVDMAHQVFMANTELNVTPYLILYGLMSISGVFLITRLGAVTRWIVAKSHG